jgi:hypothetical protein
MMKLWAIRALYIETNESNALKKKNLIYSSGKLQLPN